MSKATTADGLDELRTALRRFIELVTTDGPTLPAGNGARRIPDATGAARMNEATDMLMAALDEARDHGLNRRVYLLAMKLLAVPAERSGERRWRVDEVIGVDVLGGFEAVALNVLGLEDAQILSAKDRWKAELAREDVEVSVGGEMAYKEAAMMKWHAEIERRFDAAYAVLSPGLVGKGMFPFAAPYDKDYQILAYVLKQATGLKHSDLVTMDSFALLELMEKVAGIGESSTAELSKMESQVGEPSTDTPTIRPCDRRARSARDWAIENIPGAEAMTDREVFNALKADTRWDSELPPNADTFARYVRRAGGVVNTPGGPPATRSIGRSSQL